MSLDLERAAMKGKLAELDQQETRLIMRIESAAKALRTGLNLSLCEAHDLAVPQLDEQFDILKISWGELLKCRADIDRLKRELE